jgi:hypothetical protein
MNALVDALVLVVSKSCKGMIGYICHEGCQRRNYWHTVRTANCESKFLAADNVSTGTDLPYDTGFRKKYTTKRNSNNHNIRSQNPSCATKSCQDASRIHDCRGDDPPTVAACCTDPTPRPPNSSSSRNARLGVEAPELAIFSICSTSRGSGGAYESADERRDADAGASSPLIAR